MKTRAFRKIFVAILTLSVVAGIAFAVISHEKELDAIQEELLSLIEEEEGNYNGDKIVLSNTNKAEAEKIANSTGGKLRITDDGTFATITLPDGKTIEDFASDDNNRKYLKRVSLDF